MDGGHNIVQETGIKTSPNKKKCKNAKWLSEEVLEIDMKRREAKGKGEKERYTHFSPLPKSTFQSPPGQNPKSFFFFKSKILIHRHMILSLSLLKTFPSHDHFRFPLLTFPSSRLELLESSLVLTHPPSPNPFLPFHLFSLINYLSLLN